MSSANRRSHPNDERELLKSTPPPSSPLLARYGEESWNEGGYREIILETPPSHVSHWLHLDLPERAADLGYPVTTAMATH
ncbi:MAG: hypothetical protein ACJ75S_11670 [Solirubrobacterales bacterium]